MIRRRGQVIIATALILALLMLTISTSLHFTSTTYQKLYYDDTKEVVDNINSNLKKVLSRILVYSSEKYFINVNVSQSLDKESLKGLQNTLRAAAYNNLTFWIQSIIAAYSTKGIQLKVNGTNLLKIEWGERTGITQSNVELKLNITYLNFFNWNKNYSSYLKINIVGIKSDKRTIVFGLYKENEAPVSKIESCWVYKIKENGKEPIKYNNIVYSDGLYYLNLTGQVREYENIAIYVKDSRGIYVGATFVAFTFVRLLSRSAILYTDFSIPPNATFVINGISWNGTMLCSSDLKGSCLLSNYDLIDRKGGAITFWFIQKIYYSSPNIMFSNISILLLVVK
ncbi:MAG: hypothetical protein QW076_06210 [Candidatus Anstonellales archaeon]